MTGQILAGVGKAVIRTIRQIDIPCRYGGDEFCIILPRTDIDGAKGVCARLIEGSRDLFGDSVSFSIGIVQNGPEKYLDLNSLLKTADDLMYRGHKSVPYCPRCGTALSSHEVSLGYEDVEDPSLTFVAPVVDADGNPDPDGRAFLAWTTTPWTVPSNAGLAVHPGLMYVEVARDGRRYIVAQAMRSGEELIQRIFSDVDSPETGYAQSEGDRAATSGGVLVNRRA